MNLKPSIQLPLEQREQSGGEGQQREQRGAKGAKESERATW